MQEEEKSNILKFKDAEDAWAWFCRCEELKKELVAFDKASLFERPCQSTDIYLIMKKLISFGCLKPIHLKILLFFGMRNIVPDNRLDKEKSLSKLWNEAMFHLGNILKKKGFIDV